VRFADDVTTVKQQRKTENRSQISLSKKKLELHVLEYTVLTQVKHGQPNEGRRLY